MNYNILGWIFAGIGFIWMVYDIIKFISRRLNKNE